MKRRIVITLWVLMIILLAALETIYGQEASRAYPFSEIVPWDDKSARQSYEDFLAKAGITIQTIPLFPPRDAEREECLFLYERRLLVGYGIMLTNLRQTARAIYSKDRREIDVEKVEIIYGVSGKHIFLVSYRFRLNGFQMFIAEKFMNKEPRAVRKPFHEKIDDKYELDDSTKNLASALMARGRECAKMPDKGNAK